MLMLRRKAGESIVIAGNIRVQVAAISGNHVELLIDAPRQVPVYRSEVWEAIRREMLEAAGATGPAGEAKPSPLAGGHGSIIIEPSEPDEDPGTSRP